MIQVNNVTKKFGSFTALNNMSCKISDGCIYGLIGSNGAGKSTFLRLITGVYKPDEGQVLLDGEPVYENPAAKAKIAYVPDELFLTVWQSSTPRCFRIFLLSAFRNWSNSSVFLLRHRLIRFPRECAARVLRCWRLPAGPSISFLMKPLTASTR